MRKISATTKKRHRDPRQNTGSFSYINRKLHLGHSHIAGTGYFATERIKKDEKLVVQSGRCVHVGNIDTETMKPYWYYGFQIERDIYYYPLYMDGQLYLDGIFRINHSCAPNAGFFGQITLVAMCDIEVGGEITYDYAMTDIETELESSWSPETCRCGSRWCREKITGADWKMPELQERYAGYFSTHVASAISETSPGTTTL